MFVKMNSEREKNLYTFFLAKASPLCFKYISQ